jgi:hypothetical protein
MNQRRKNKHFIDNIQLFINKDSKIFLNFNSFNINILHTSLRDAN